MLTPLKLKQAVAQELEQNILEYWLKMMDVKHGGFYCFADFDGCIDSEHKKSVLLHSRILWSFAAAYRVLPNDKYLAAAEHTYNFIIEHALDREHGGMYWMLDAQGQPCDKQKHVYNQSFAIYALSEYYQASGNEKALKIAIELFEQIENYAYDNDFGGYSEAFSQDWKSIDNHLVCDTEEDVLADKSMNTHLHIMEAYANLHRCWPNALVQQRIEELLRLFKDKIINRSLHFGLFFTSDWKCISKDVSYGHDIEGTWLMDDAANQLSNRTFAQEIKALTSRMAKVTLKEGRDSDGSIFNELREGRMLDSDRIWWVQAEAMVGFYNAFQKEFLPAFWEATHTCWSVIANNLVDDQNGEWYWRTNRHGSPYLNDPKVEPWKCPYHNGRACLEIYSRINAYEEYNNACC
ncbi:AGE family epimerase/isomerase [Agarivorans sp. Alg241-V36]|uniref:AGE family epimerase/isomerase n=1 Tax=Agarivorans sp. Alg241-V36 TaxID=2305992 RepID=UPI0013D24B1D|nr:AGE family epimerase/isomerase [Agarivorans sp. Alg241-V36]